MFHNLKIHGAHLTIQKRKFDLKISEIPNGLKVCKSFCTDKLVFIGSF